MNGPGQTLVSRLVVRLAGAFVRPCCGGAARSRTPSTSSSGIGVVAGGGRFPWRGDASLCVVLRLQVGVGGGVI